MNKNISKFASLTVAIDGPAGAGKGTAARNLANKLNLTHIDSGAMYRAVALAANRRLINFEDSQALGDLLPKLSISYTLDAGHSQIKLDGEIVESFIRSADISHGASVVSQHLNVRAILVEKQRQLGEKGGVVMEGRDIGTVVFPKADLKIFLNATLAERARRRFAERIAKGYEADYETILAELTLRDQRDRDRQHSPMIKADDAVEIYTDDLSIDQVVERLTELALKCLKSK